MSSDKMREEFEAWSANHDYLGGCKTQMLDDRYIDIDLQHSWESWKASRAALVIDLPKVIGSLMYSSDVYEAVEAAGLKVKP